MPSYRAYSHAIERNLILYDSGLLDKPWQQRKDQSEKVIDLQQTPSKRQPVAQIED
tara:strand:- start:76 stop:243 length:168 start_codon:yes stop_codon:yes gene_type:complete